VAGYGILLLSLVCLIAIGARFTPEQQDAVDFFLARRRVPWWAACLSFLATEISAVTLIAVPATAYSENWQYFEFFVARAWQRSSWGSCSSRPSTATTARRSMSFWAIDSGGPLSLWAPSSSLVTRLFDSGVRLMAACLAVSILFLC